MLRAEFIILMRRLQSGDIGALAPLYEEYFQKMYSTVLVMLHSAEDAYDVATAAILKLADYCLRGMEWRCRRKCFGWMI